MGRSYNILIFTVLISFLCACLNESKEYSNVYWLPEKKDLAGTYLLDREFHENDNLSKDSIMLFLNKNGTFKTKNFLFSNNARDLKPISYAEGIWNVQKNPISNAENSYSNSVILKYDAKYYKYNDKNNFLKTEELQMKLSDSSFIICFFTGDPDHSQYRYYFNQLKKK